MIKVWSSNTVSGYKTGMGALRSFLSFPLPSGCVVKDLWNPFDSGVNESGWIAFMLWLKRPKLRGGRGVTFDTAQAYLGGVCSVIAVVTGTRPSLAKMPLLVMAKKAWRRVSRPQRKKRGLTYTQLQAIIKRGQLGKKRDRVGAAITVLGYHGLLRLAEIFEEGIAWENITVGDDNVELWLPGSKTDVFREGSKATITRQVWDLIVDLLQVDPRTATGRLFCITRASYLKWLSHSLDDDQWGHSLRRGGAQHLFNCGVPVEVIKRRGRWVSDCVYRYLHCENSDARVVSEALASQ